MARKGIVMEDNFVLVMLAAAASLTLVGGCANSQPLQQHLYNKYSLVKVEINTREDIDVIKSLPEQVKIWLTPHLGDVAAILVPPDLHDSTLKTLKDEGLSFKVTQDDIQKDIDHEKAVDLQSAMSHRRLHDLVKHNLTWDAYHDEEDFKTYYKYLSRDHGDIVDVSSIGTTYEGRDIVMIKICASGHCGKKPAILMDGGIHAREWISPAATLMLIDKIVNTLKSSKKSIMKKVDWYIIPLLNPDGYAYSRTIDRLWRKNRVPNEGCDKDECVGVDLNRNFDYQWDHKDNHADLYNMSSEAYHGPEPFSEKESQALKEFILDHKDHIKAYVTIHSFGQFILTPWGFTREKPKSWPKLSKVIKKTVDKIEAFTDEKYKFLHVLDLTEDEIVTGNSVDWAYGVAKIPYVFGIELRDRGVHGFELPAPQIIETSKELRIFMGVLAKEITRGPFKLAAQAAQGNKRLFSYTKQTIIDKVTNL